MRIIIVRHGEPDYKNDCLTEKGKIQAEAAAKRLLSENINEIFSSPLGRAYETAQAFADLDGNAPVHVLDFMHELEWGSADGTQIFAGGHPWDIADKLVRDGYDLADTAWREHPYFSNNLVTAAADYVAAESDKWLKTLGYIREGSYYRCRRKDDEQYSVALFCHGGSSTALLSRILNIPFPYLCATVHLDFTGIFIIRMDRRPNSISMPVIELAGDEKHIRGIE